MRRLQLCAVTALALAGLAAADAQSYDEGVAPTRPGPDAEAAQFEGEAGTPPRELPPPSAESGEAVDVNAVLDDYRQRFEAAAAARAARAQYPPQFEPADPGEVGRLSRIMRDAQARIAQVDELLAGHSQGGVIVAHRGAFFVISRDQLAQMIANRIVTDDYPDYEARAASAYVRGHLQRSDAYAAQLAADRAIYAAQDESARRGLVDLFARQSYGLAAEQAPPPQTAAERFGVPLEIAARAIERREIRYEECWHAGGNPNSGCTTIQHSIWVYTLDNGQTYWDRAEYDARRAEMTRSGYSFAWSRELPAR